MKLRVPYYYDEFQCTAGECKDNCCVGGWEIDIDEETYEYYCNMQGEIGQKLRDNIIKNDAGEYCFKLVDGCCPMLTKEGLCLVHKELGEGYLGVVCSQFPRYSEYYGVVKESGIGMACEEAARLMLYKNRSFSMKEEALAEEYEVDAEYDSDYATKIFRLRDFIFQLLAKEGLSIYEKLIIILSLGSDVQEHINNGEYDKIKYVLNSYTKEYADRLLKETRAKCDNGEYDLLSLQDCMRDILLPYEEMEVLSADWELLLKDVINCLHEQMDKEEYGILCNEFAGYITDREYEYRQITEYFVFRYFAKSVYDYDVLGKCQMLVTNFLVIRHMDMFRWLDNHRSYTFEDRMFIMHIFSRQVEYSEENIEQLYEDYLFDDIFKPDSLRAILWLDNDNV